MSTAVFIVFIFIGALYWLITAATKSSVFEAASANVACIYLLLAGFLFGWCLCGLTSFHMYLISNGMTTNEEIKRSRAPGGQAAAQIAAADGEQRDCTDRFSIALASELPPSRIDLLAPAPRPAVSAAAARWLEAAAAARAHAASQQQPQQGATPSPAAATAATASHFAMEMGQ